MRTTLTEPLIELRDLLVRYRSTAAAGIADDVQGIVRRITEVAEEIDAAGLRHPDEAQKRLIREIRNLLTQCAFITAAMTAHLKRFFEAVPAGSAIRGYDASGQEHISIEPRRLGAV